MTASAAAARLSGAAYRLVGMGAARGAASALGFLGVLMVARLLEPQALGHWSLALAVQGFALHLAEFGLRSVATTELVGAGAAWRALLARYLGLRLLLAGLVVVAVLAGAAVLRPESLGLVALATLAIAATALQLDWIALVDNRLGLAALPLVARPLAFVLLLAAWPGTAGPLAVALSYLLSWWLAAALSWPALHRPLRDRVAGTPLGPRRLLARGAPLMLVTLTNQAQLSADLLVVGWSLGAARAGDYYLASQIAVAALLFANAANQLALARLPRLAGRPREFAAELAGEAARLARVALLIVVALAVTAPWLLPYLFGAEHGHAASALLWLLPWLLLQHLTALLQGALTAVRRERAVLGSNLVLLLVLAPALALAVAGGTLAGFAAARGVAELGRLVTLFACLKRAGLARP